jgi:hypothetical protein
MPAVSGFLAGLYRICRVANLILEGGQSCQFVHDAMFKNLYFLENVFTYFPPPYIETKHFYFLKATVHRD